MPLFFLIFGLLSIMLVVTIPGSIVVGFLLQRTRRFKTLGVFAMLVPPLACVGAGLLSWGSMLWADSMSRKAVHDLKAMDQWEIAAFWAWPIGFVLGALVGGLVGALFGVLIVKRRRLRTVRS